MVATAVDSMGLPLLLMSMMRIASHFSYRISKLVCGSTVVEKRGKFGNVPHALL